MHTSPSTTPTPSGPILVLGGTGKTGRTSRRTFERRKPAIRYVRYCKMREVKLARLPWFIAGAVNRSRSRRERIAKECQLIPKVAAVGRR